MGWLFYTDNRISTHAEEKAEIQRLCTWETETETNVPLQVSKVGSTWYVAIKKSPVGAHVFTQDTYVLEPDGSFVFAAIFMVKYDGGFGYKDLTETCGPNDARAPITLLAKLSDLTDSDSYAHGWRDKCKQWAAVPVYKIGDVIELAKPVSLQSGIEVLKVECTTYRRRSRNMRCYKDLETGTLCRLSKDCFVGSKLLRTASVTGSSILKEFNARRDQAA